MRQSKNPKPISQINDFRHSNPDQASPLPPDVGTQSHFKQRKPPHGYTYDPSLAPELVWDGQSAAREQGEALIQQILQAETLEQAQAAAQALKRMSQPFLNWAGKGERLSFDVPTVPLFVHERLSTAAIIETLRSHERQMHMDSLFADPERSIVDQLLRPYEHAAWVNRLVLGDSLVVMNSLLHYERLGKQVQMIYIDPPYGVKFGSNFQPFVRRRDVSHNDDADMTREPEMVQAYRDTWELGLHSYLTYLRDRLLLARELLHPTGSVFVQISDDNLHHVREVMDEVFGAENFVSIIVLEKTSSSTSNVIASINDYLVWYGKDNNHIKYSQLYKQKELGEAGTTQYVWLESPDGTTDRRMISSETSNPETIPDGWRIFACDNLTSQRPPRGTDVRSFLFKGKEYLPGKGTFKTDKGGLESLASRNRLKPIGNSLMYKRYLSDFVVSPVANIWSDVKATGFTDEKLYVVQTAAKVIERCILMTTDPGDLVLDPTCGSGTTPYVAEQWGRRWIAIDTSRVPLALARQRLLTATFPDYALKDPQRGPLGGFMYQRRQNRKGEEVGGIVPHITLKSIANAEPPTEEILVDRPEVVPNVTRVTGPFRVEATIAMPSGGGPEADETLLDSHASFNERMIEILRRSPVLHLGDNKTITFQQVRVPANRSLVLAAEALVENGQAKPVAFVFGPENGAVSEMTVYQAAMEAYAKHYQHLYIIGFAIQPNARALVEKSSETMNIAATYVQATPDLLMKDLLKTMRSSQIFSVTGLPDVVIERAADGRYQVTLAGLDVFDPSTMEVDHRRGDDVPAWLLDTNYNGRCFHVSQAFFPRTSAWDNLQRALKGTFNPSVWEHLSGTTSEPFAAGEHQQIAVKVIDDRGNELLVVHPLGAVE
ncbi:MAG: site-specific DNA-methyltransferase [Herpetosiphonaceae bacterium]|nr:site-specific DNA-methyltransferase [Herpetosiphonaceae bacterium]